MSVVGAWNGFGFERIETAQIELSCCSVSGHIDQVRTIGRQRNHRALSALLDRQRRSRHADASDRLRHRRTFRWTDFSSHAVVAASPMRATAAIAVNDRLLPR